MKSIVTKLVIYKKDPRFDYCPTPYYCEGHFVGGGQFCSYCGITDTQAQEKEIENTFIGDDAMREYWTIKFNNLQEQERKLILSAFPDIESKDKITLKDPQELYAIAFRKVLRRFAVVVTVRRRKQKTAKRVTISRKANKTFNVNYPRSEISLSAMPIIAIYVSLRGSGF